MLLRVEPQEGHMHSTIESTSQPADVALFFGMRPEVINAARPLPAGIRVVWQSTDSAFWELTGHGGSLYFEGTKVSATLRTIGSVQEKDFLRFGVSLFWFPRVSSMKCFYVQ